MQTKTNVKKSGVEKQGSPFAWVMQAAGAVAGGVGAALSGGDVKDVLTAAGKGALSPTSAVDTLSTGIGDKMNEKKVAEQEVAQKNIQQAQKNVVDNSAEMNNATASTNLSTKPVYNPSDPLGTGVDPTMLEKRGPVKELSPIKSYYGEAKNLSSLAYRDSILMKTVSGVNTLGNKEDRIIVGKDYKRGSYVPEYILEDMIREQTDDEPKDSVQDYTKVRGFGKNKYVKPRKK